MGKIKKKKKMTKKKELPSKRLATKKSEAKFGKIQHFRENLHVEK